ncbi:MAG: hypothetical protein LBM13_05570 [Candidatus Ancillula sp.]|jgi:hypothetical protein|nr:hypothetical protein [Candidatus Ancillula sp.]
MKEYLGGVVLFVVCLVWIFLGTATASPQFMSSWIKIDQKASNSTYQTGNYNIEDTGNSICGNNEDYLSCVNQSVSVYNSVCVNKNLTASANKTCDDFSSFIDEIKQKYDSCGYGCTTSSENGKWGWDYLEDVPETKTKTIPEEKHAAFCYLGNGWLKIGECKEKNDEY